MSSSHRHRTLACLPALVLAVSTASPAPASAATSVTDLGKPTNARPQNAYFPAGYFQRKGPVLRSHGKPELLFMGTQVDGQSAAERWALVKALGQFGTLSGVSSLRQPICSLSTQGGTTAPQCYPLNGTYEGKTYQWGVATFDLRKAAYASRYLAFVDVELIDKDAHALPTGRLSATESTLFHRYLFQTAIGASAISPFWQAVGSGQTKMPMVDVGGFVETGTNVVPPIDLVGPNANGAVGDSPWVPFTVIQHSLQTGRLTSQEVPTLLNDFNAEANVITAVICRADGGKPASVCARPVIKFMLKHIK